MKWRLEVHREVFLVSNISLRLQTLSGADTQDAKHAGDADYADHVVYAMHAEDVKHVRDAAFADHMQDAMHAEDTKDAENVNFADLDHAVDAKRAKVFNYTEDT